MGAQWKSICQLCIAHGDDGYFTRCTARANPFRMTIERFYLQKEKCGQRTPGNESAHQIKLFRFRICDSVVYEYRYCVLKSFLEASEIFFNAKMC